MIDLHNRLSIKAKLVSVADGIETFEQAFMAYVVMPDGLTLGYHVVQKIAAAYDTGTMPPLLLGQSGYSLLNLNSVHGQLPDSKFLVF